MPISSSLFGMLRRAVGIGSLAIVVGALSACATEPEPEPAWTEEEAYAAAEETFRAFSNAAYDLEASTLDYVTGDMVELERDAEQAAAAAQLEIRGEVEVLNFEPLSFDAVGDSVALSATACIDSSRVELKSEGEDWKQPRERPVYGVEVSFTSVRGELLIDDFSDSEDVKC